MALQKQAYYLRIATSGAIERITDGYNLSRQTTKLLLVEQHVINLLSLMNFINIAGLTSNG
jgi:hypothetical protein